MLTREDLTSIQKMIRENVQKIVNERVDFLAISVAKEFKNIQAEFKDVRDEFTIVRSEMRTGFAQVNERFDRVEFFIKDHEHRLNRAEDTLKQVKTKIGLALN